MRDYTSRMRGSGDEDLELLSWLGLDAGETRWDSPDSSTMPKDLNVGQLVVKVSRYLTIAQTWVGRSGGIYKVLACRPPYHVDINSSLDKPENYVHFAHFEPITEDEAVMLVLRGLG